MATSRMNNPWPTDLIGLMADRQPDLLLGMLGILKSGCGIVPIDPEHPSERIRFILDDCRISILVTEAKYLAKAAALVKSYPGLKHVICLDGVDRSTTAVDGVSLWDFRDAAGEAPAEAPDPARLDRFAYVIYTSGSTGTPKGVPITHRNLDPLLSWSEDRFRLDDRTCALQNLNYCFDFGVFELLTTLLCGGTLHFLDRGSVCGFSDYARYIDEHGINTLHTTPSFLANLLADAARLESLRLVHLGGEALSAHLVERIYERVDDSCIVYNGYGPTEATVNCSLFEAGDRAGWHGQGRSTVPIGQPSANHFLYILDENGEPVPVYVPGELHVAGDGLSQGYLNRPDLTAEKFVPNPLGGEPGSRLYRTGDRARHLPDGNIEFLGRIDHQVKIRGFRIELGEIEHALGQHPAVREAAVLAHEPRPGQKRLIAYLVAARRPAPSQGDLREFLKGCLPDYMVPSAFLWLDAMPLTPNGKLDRRALPDPEAAPPEPETPFLAPRTRREQILAELWSQVLGVARVGVRDDFFELGGDSMTIIRLVGRANQAGLSLTAAEVFQHPTIEAQAQLGDEARGVHAEQGTVRGAVPLTPIQHFFFDQDLPEPHHWNWSFLRKVSASWDPALLRRTIGRLLAHHDALRLRFRRTASGWEQFHAELDDNGVPLTIVDLSGVPSSRRREALESAAARLQASLHLSEGPLMRVAYFRLDAHEARLLIVFHHLVVDMVSSHILMEDVVTLLGQLHEGRTPALPPKTTSYREWSLRLSQYAQSDELLQECHDWHNALSAPVSSLPLDFPRGVNSEDSADLVVETLGSDDTEALLRGLPKTLKVQMEEVLLTALARTLTSWTGQNVLVDLEGHGRDLPLDGVDLSRTVGWFTCVYPVVLEATGPIEPEQALGLIQRQLRRIRHGGVGYGVLRYLSNDAGISRRLTELPRAEVNFNYLGRLDQASPQASPFRSAPESRGPERSAKGLRRFPLYVAATVRNGVLRMHWNYSRHLHQRTTVEHLARHFMDQLRWLRTAAR